MRRSRSFTTCLAVPFKFQSATRTLFRQPIMNYLCYTGRKKMSYHENRFVERLSNNSAPKMSSLVLTWVLRSRLYSFLVNAERVVELCLKPAFATPTYNLARIARVKTIGDVANLFAEHKAVLACRWHSVLFKKRVEFRQNQCNNV